MERMMGKADNPLRSILNYASEKYLENEMDLWYILTVIGRDPETNELRINGFYIGNTIECYKRACELSLQVNFTKLQTAPKRIVVYLDEDEFHSTWLGNKVIM
jgi:nickel-dependent lactate racemase